MIARRFAPGLALAIASVLPMSALAQKAQTPAGHGQGMIVVRDAETGKLRAPTAEEQAALQAEQTNKRAAQRIAPQTPLTKYHPSGATGSRLTEEFVSYSVLVRNADGSLSEQSFSSKEEAEAAIKNGSVVGKPAVATE